MDKIEYTLIRSRRRTLALEVTGEMTVVVRAPLSCPQRSIDAFVEEHRQWIARHMESQRQRRAAHPEPDGARRQELIDRARRELPQRVARYAAQMGLTPTGISITGAQKRFGSCSGRNRLCFAWRLMDYPDAAIDAVVVHELAHIVHKNHGPAFYALVESVLPDYRERVRLLR
ncbi:MAG: M48 family metallopeptidase [Oscillospiraceae bacterium]|nr:M48 family metallopeptidase [Oscillospiraceae bacterium]